MFFIFGFYCNKRDPRQYIIGFYCFCSSVLEKKFLLVTLRQTSVFIKSRIMIELNKCMNLFGLSSTIKKHLGLKRTCKSKIHACRYYFIWEHLCDIYFYRLENIIKKKAQFQFDDAKRIFATAPITMPTGKASF